MPFDKNLTALSWVNTLHKLLRLWRTVWHVKFAFLVSVCKLRKIKNKATEMALKTVKDK